MLGILNALGADCRMEENRLVISAVSLSGARIPEILAGQSDLRSCFLDRCLHVLDRWRPVCRGAAALADDGGSAIFWINGTGGFGGKTKWHDPGSLPIRRTERSQNPSSISKCRSYGKHPDGSCRGQRRNGSDRGSPGARK